MSLSREELRKLLDLLDATKEEEIDCDELLSRLGGYLEDLGPDGVPPPGYEEVTQHLRVCAECFEEFDALYRVLHGKGDDAA